LSDGNTSEDNGNEGKDSDDYEVPSLSPQISIVSSILEEM